eukprot:Skav221179  [mRNA]  locus=scaffold5346:11435:12448:+ [translate_table: standard]
MWLALVPGNLKALRSSFQRVRGSFQKLLSLQQVPDMTIDDAEAEKLAAMRQIPGKDEKVTQWAIEDDSKVKQPLPSWIALPIERKVTEWAAENSKWESKVEDRAAIGRPLAPTAQKRYDEFVKDKSDCKLLFSKKDQKQVVKLRSNADWRKLQDDLFTIQIQMSSDPEHLRIKAADGSSQRLLLWQGEPTKKDMLPMFLANAGVSAAVAEAALQDFHEHEEKGEDSDASQEVPDGEAQQQEALEQLEKEEGDSGAEEFAAGSSEEEVVRELAEHEEVRRVKDFNHRPEYRALSARGAVMLPPGSFVSYHKSSRQWQGDFCAGRAEVVKKVSLTVAKL